MCMHVCKTTPPYQVFTTRMVPVLLCLSQPYCTWCLPSLPLTTLPYHGACPPCLSQPYRTMVPVLLCLSQPYRTVVPVLLCLTVPWWCGLISTPATCSHNPLAKPLLYVAANFQGNITLYIIIPTALHDSWRVISPFCNTVPGLHLLPKNSVLCLSVLAPFWLSPAHRVW